LGLRAASRAGRGRLELGPGERRVQFREPLVAASERKAGELVGPLAAGGGRERERALDRVEALGRLPKVERRPRRQIRHRDRGPYGASKRGSLGSGTAVSRSQPSFSSLMCWIATAFALASRSGKAWNSETHARNTL